MCAFPLATASGTWRVMVRCDSAWAVMVSIIAAASIAEHRETFRCCIVFICLILLSRLGFPIFGQPLKYNGIPPNATPKADFGRIAAVAEIRAYAKKHRAGPDQGRLEWLVDRGCPYFLLHGKDQVIVIVVCA
jgi:hypothetical protein